MPIIKTRDGREIELDFVDSFDRLLAAYQEDFDRLKTDETDQLNAEGTHHVEDEFGRLTCQPKR